MVSHQSQSMPAASLLVQQSSGDGSVFKDGVEVEQNSECSQVGCSQTASDISKTQEDFLVSEESDLGKLHNASPTASCSEQFYTSVEDMTFTIPDIPYEFSCSSRYLEDNYSREPGACASGSSSFGAFSLPNVTSVDLSADSSSRNCFLADPNNETVPGPSQHSIEYDALASVNNVAARPDATGQKQKTEEGCSQLVLHQEGGDGFPVNLNNCSEIIDMDRYREYISFQTFYQLSETSGNVGLQPNHSLDTLVEASNCEHISSIPTDVSDENGLMLSSQEYNQVNDNLAVPQDIAKVDEEFGAHHNSSSPCSDHIIAGLTEHSELEKPSRLVPVGTFGAERSDSQPTHSNIVERPVKATSEREAGTLCYEPPRFPSLDIPFFSCDLAQSANDAHQEFSPLGIRQLMMSSMNSLTPFKLWDSPSSDDSPDRVLKSAAKTFSCTPSILKKRHRDLLSPLSPFSERRCDKRTGSNVKQGFLWTSRLTNEFSRLDVMFDDTDECKILSLPSNDQNSCALIEDKENICPAFEGQNEEAKLNRVESGNRTSEENKDINRDGNLEQDVEKSVRDDCASETVSIL